MKKIVIAIIIAIAAIALFVFWPSTVHYTEPQVVTEVVTEEVESVEVRIKAAQDAARGDIEAKAQEAYDHYVEQALTQIATEVRDEYIAELEAVNEADKAKVQSY